MANTPKWYVASYGDMGLEVTFYADENEYQEAIETAEELHDQGELDSYTYGDVEIWQPPVMKDK